MTIRERLFVGTSSDEHVEIYLKAMWLIKENNEPIRVSTVASLLRIRQPSVVQMMKKIDRMTVDWIRDLPTVNEINGIEILVSDTTKKSSHGSGGGCGGGDHGESSHEDKGKGGHEGGCPHFQMVKKMIPQIELLENGVSQVDRSMKITLSVGSSELTMPIVADENLSGLYTVVFVPTVAGNYGVEVHGTIHGTPVNMMVEMDKVYDKNQVTRFP